MKAREVHGAGRNEKAFVDEMQNATRQTGGKVRAEIKRAVFFDAAREVDTRIFFRRGELDVRIGLVVAENDIELGLILFDQIVLEGQGFTLVADKNGFEVGDLAHERAGFGVGPARFEKVGAHAAAQIPRFADVQNRAAGIFKEIDARILGKQSGFFAGFHVDFVREATIAGQVPSY